MCKASVTVLYALIAPWNVNYEKCKIDSTMEKPSLEGAKAHQQFKLKGPKVVASSRPQHKAFLAGIKEGKDENGGLAITKAVQLLCEKRD